MQSGIPIGKIDIFRHNHTQNVLTYDHHLCCLLCLEKTNLTKIGVWPKSLTTPNFLDVRKYKEVIGRQVRAVHNFDVLADQKDAALSRCARTRIAIVNNDSSCLVRFSNFSKEVVVYHSELTVQHCPSGTAATRPV